MISCEIINVTNHKQWYTCLSDCERLLKKYDSSWLIKDKVKVTLTSGYLCKFLSPLLIQVYEVSIGFEKLKKANNFSEQHYFVTKCDENKQHHF